MKTLKSLLVAGLALASSALAVAQSSAPAWLETYYVNPRPGEFVAQIGALSRAGYFERPGHTALAIGFIATVFAQHPTQVEGWVAALGDLPAPHKRLVAASLWQAGHPLGAELLRHCDPRFSVYDAVQRLADTPAQRVVDTSVCSPSSMNLQWGAFLASGDERYVTNILEALGQGEPTLDRAARVSLAARAAAHPRVLEICRAHLAREPEAAPSVLRAALQEAESKPRT